MDVPTGTAQTVAGAIPALASFTGHMPWAAVLAAIALIVGPAYLGQVLRYREEMARLRNERASH